MVSGTAEPRQEPGSDASPAPNAAAMAEIAEPEAQPLVNLTVATLPSAMPFARPIIITGNNLNYVSANSVNNAPMVCNRPTAGPWEQFLVVGTGTEGKVALMDLNGRYMSSESGETAMHCNRTSVGPWEQFTWVPGKDGGQQFSLCGSNGKYVSSENGTGPMTCNRQEAGLWETFQFQWADAGALENVVLAAGADYPDPTPNISGPPLSLTIALVGYTNSGDRYVSVNGGGELMSTGVETADAERFFVFDLGDNYVALLGSQGKYVSSEAGKQPMHCNRQTIGDWERFRWETYDTAMGRFKLWNNNRYVSSRNGEGPMTCNTLAIDPDTMDVQPITYRNLLKYVSFAIQ